MLDDEGWGDNQERHEAEAVADVRPVEAGPGVGFNHEGGGSDVVGCLGGGVGLSESSSIWE